MTPSWDNSGQRYGGDGHPFPNYIVLESTKYKVITKLSPFTQENFLSANVSLKSVKTTRYYSLVVEVVESRHAKFFLEMTPFYNIKERFVTNYLTPLEE